MPQILDFNERSEATRKRRPLRHESSSAPPRRRTSRNRDDTARSGFRDSGYEQEPETETEKFQSRNPSYPTFDGTGPLFVNESIPGPDVFHHFYWYVFLILRRAVGQLIFPPKEMYDSERRGGILCP